ncbi:hypothetical protein [Arthrobacter zhaoxinii]|uniref:hypothetical protein n=1 Tax=Arthrobacter zhaoxinii TaxID=2964616 RepID=UPI0021053B72|nr:hypothetical protein [Arthrobacter zhaoxinii]MCQ1999476.1 hypothetical protein [Arthrobacter zhaoxinii]
MACSALVDSIGTYRENGSLTQLDALEALYDAVLAQNTSVGVEDTLEDIETALVKLYNGQDPGIDLLVISLAYCS